MRSPTGYRFFSINPLMLGETIKFLCTPDFYSLVKGRFWDDWYATTKFNVFLLLCFGWAAAITELLARHVL